MSFKEFWNYGLFTLTNHQVTVSDILVAIIVLGVFRLVFLLIRATILRRRFRAGKMDEGQRFAVTQLLSYFSYVIGFLVAIEVMGLNLTVLYAAGAALLVGVGLGLQQTFNDVLSGIILLTEGSIKKGDWLEVGDLECQVMRIGFRTSIVKTRRRIVIVVPNSRITINEVVNLTHSRQPVRWIISVGVAYGSDTRLVERTLIDCAKNHLHVMKEPAPFVRFENFGNSSLDFELHFWSTDFRRIMDIKSDLRFMIDDSFRKAGVTIPFPQRDLHIKSGLNPPASSGNPLPGRAPQSPPPRQGA